MAGSCRTMFQSELQRGRVQMHADRPPAGNGGPSPPPGFNGAACRCTRIAIKKAHLDFSKAASTGPRADARGSEDLPGNYFRHGKGFNGAACRCTRIVAARYGRNELNKASTGPRADARGSPPRTTGPVHPLRRFNGAACRCTRIDTAGYPLQGVLMSFNGAACRCTRIEHSAIR